MKKVLAFVGILVLGMIPLWAQAATINVPGAYPTIQKAIDTAITGDTVLVEAGTYTENINFLGKSIIVKSVHGTASTIIDGNKSGSVVTFSSGEGSKSVLDGFTITNGSSTYGGGIKCCWYSSPTITNCTINYNLANWGGGISCSFSSSPLIINCTISYNLANWGGGIFCSDSSSSTITNCIISNNSADYNGGGIFCSSSSSPTTINCIISNNSADCNGGGICCYSSSSPTITNCTISNNSGSNGGGIHCYSPSPMITNFTISNNSAKYYSGGIKYYDYSSPTIVNSIFWDDSPQEIYLSNVSINIAYSNIKGNWAGTGNINVDPLFIGGNDYHFQATSLCINTGSNTTLSATITTDLDGNPRIVNGIVDMGAYEFQETPSLQYGSLFITSTPTGANIWLDGVDKNTITPAILTGITPGTHTIKLTLPGHYDWTNNSVTVTAGTTTPVFTTLGTISFTPVWQKGFSYTSWWHDSYDSADSNTSIDNLGTTGTKWVSLLVTWYQDTATSTNIYRDINRTPDDAGLIQAIDRIHALGMKVMLKPHVDCQDGTWRGQIESADWDAWFGSYTTFINYYADLAKNNGVDQFCIGCELEKSVSCEDKWREVIGGVRSRFGGPITYAANWDSYDKIHFWDALDYAGVDAYFPLTDKDTPTIPELIDRWNRWAGSLTVWQGNIQKPVVFTEIGYRSVDGMNKAPYEWTGTGTIDLQEQADCYESAFQVFQDKPWFYGMYWWNWTTEPAQGGQTDLNYTPHNKPAEGVLCGWYKDLPPLPTDIIQGTATNTGSITVTINGHYFRFGAGVKLTSGTSTIFGTSTVVIPPATITSTFNLADAPSGTWSVIVINLDDQSGTLTDGFRIMDSIPPGTITNLSLATTTATSTTLTWTAPGDDGYIGAATGYDIRYATFTITEDNWSSATQCSDTLTPKLAGSTETFTVNKLQPNTTYYFVIKAKDDSGLWSALSNIATSVAATPIELNHDFPRIMYAVQLYEYTAENIEKLAKYDMLVIGDIVQEEQPDMFPTLRQLNPDIKILAYVDPIEIHTSAKDEATSSIAYQRYARVNDSSWWLKNISGGHARVFEDQWLVDVTNQCPLNNGERWNTFLPDFVHEKVMSTGLWDGIMFDNCWKRLTTDEIKDGDVDQNKDGQKDDPEWLNQKWEEGMQTLVGHARSNEGNGKLIVCNVNFFSPANGIFTEEIDNYDWHESWQNVMNNYHSAMSNGISPQVCCMQSIVKPNDPAQWKRMRCGLTSTLLNDGYFCASGLTESGNISSETYWFDEFGGIDGLNRGYLGKPRTKASLYDNKVWRRDFDNGIVLCNPYGETRTVQLETTYKKIYGTQDGTVNDGALVSIISIPANDGIILLKTTALPPAGSQTGKIFGTVTDSQENPIRDVIIYALQDGEIKGSVTTNESGNYIIPDLLSGSFTVIARKLNWRIEKELIVISQLQAEIPLQFELIPVYSEPPIEHFPLAIGNLWEYKGEFSLSGATYNQTASLTCQITGTTTISGIEAYIIRKEEIRGKDHLVANNYLTEVEGELRKYDCNEPGDDVTGHLYSSQKESGDYYYIYRGKRFNSVKEIMDYVHGEVSIPALASPRCMRSSEIKSSDSSWKLLKFPIIAGDFWISWLSKIGTCSRQVVDVETISVPAGTFTAYKIETLYPMEDIAWYSWYSPMGLIKSYTEVGNIERMEGGTFTACNTYELITPIPPIVTIFNPKNGAILTEAGQTITGTVSDTTLTTGTLTINGISQPIAIDSGTFTKAITLSPGTNRCTISVAGIADYIGSATIIVEVVSRKEVVLPGQKPTITLDNTKIEIVDNPFANATATVIINDNPKEANFVVVVADQNLPAGVSISGLAETVREFKLFEQENANAGTTTGKFKITIPYPDTIPDDKAKDLRIFWMNPATDRWELVGGTVDTVNHTVTVEVDHLSIFRLAMYATVVPDPFNIKVYPNPFKPSDGSIIFDNLPQEAIIEIFNLAGELINELSGTEKVMWKPTNKEGEKIASGIYIYLVTDKQGRKATGKFAIIR